MTKDQQKYKTYVNDIVTKRQRAKQLKNAYVSKNESLVASTLRHYERPIRINAFLAPYFQAMDIGVKGHSDYCQAKVNTYKERMEHDLEFISVVKEHQASEEYAQYEDKASVIPGVEQNIKENSEHMGKWVQTRIEKEKMAKHAKDVLVAHFTDLDVIRDKLMYTEPDTEQHADLLNQEDKTASVLGLEIRKAQRNCYFPTMTIETSAWATTFMFGISENTEYRNGDLVKPFTT